MKRYPDNDPGLYFLQPSLPQLALINTNLVKSFEASLQPPIVPTFHQPQLKKFMVSYYLFYFSSLYDCCRFPVGCQCRSPVGCQYPAIRFGQTDAMFLCFPVTGTISVCNSSIDTGEALTRYGGDRNKQTVRDQHQMITQNIPRFSLWVIPTNGEPECSLNF